MKILVSFVSLSGLTVGCAEQDDLASRVGMSIDNAPASARIAVSGNRDRLDVTIYPENAVLAGERLGTLDLRIDLSSAANCPGNCLQTPQRMMFAAKDTTGTFDHGDSTYQIDPVFDPMTQRYLFSEAGDPLHVPRGKIHGAVDFYRLDSEGARFNISIAPLFDLSLSPDPAEAHLIVIATVHAAF